ncbi:28S ribosomal protein S36, mitochondrial [Elysia marginata]|uniref:28S ribosomal protein S36, mitochondrial n=1 Tax=Elysia marginata TaxID=1093978 RepID=A0AAV4EIU8_9GAST|nr:28S ribosomal protein S36, mitochondrial [Elysia marginata]
MLIPYFKVIRPHVPLIKFPPRNAVLSNQNVLKGAPSHSQPSPAQQVPVSNKPISKGPAIESSSLPPKYHRKPLSLEEMEYIEKGGPV